MPSEMVEREIFADQARADGLSSWADAIERGDISPSTESALRAIVRAIEEEREANAKLADDLGRFHPCGANIADAIRQRGEA